MTSRALFILLALAACSPGAASTSSSGEPASPAACAPELPSTVEISEGGRARLQAPAGIEVTGSEGVVVTNAGDSVLTVRIPYGAGATPSLTTSCGRTIPITVRPLGWSKLASWSDATGAKAREYGAFWLDEVGAGGLVVFGGFHYVPKQFTRANDAWRFDFGTGAWTALAGDGLPTTPGARVARIPGQRAVYQYGGETSTKANGALGTSPSMFRLDWDEATLRATPVTKLSVDYGSYTGAFLHDAKRSRWLALCGADSTIGTHCEVATFTEAEGLRPLATAGSPPDGRYGFHYALDEENDRVVLFAGQGAGGEDDILGDAWTLELGNEPPTWKALKAAGTPPSKRRNGAWAMDTRGHRLFIWGGTPDGRTSLKGLQALSLDRGAETWTDVMVAGAVPPSRTSGLGVEDVARGRLLFGFGNDDALYRDLWALDIGAPTAASEASGDKR